MATHAATPGRSVRYAPYLTLCHPERTRISYFTALTGGHLCGSLQREPHATDRSRNYRQEIRGSRGIGVSTDLSWKCFRQSRTKTDGLQAVPFTKPSAAHPLGNYRFSTAVYFTGYSAPIYSARGRINRLSSSCSITCAAQPEILLTAKIGVNKSRSIPSMVYVEAE